MNTKDINHFRDALIGWYRVYGRTLPWRGTKDPYRIWISEIMLQQTQVDTVKPYYERFISRFPTPKVLADATEDEVFKSWEGLGYYRRAANLMTAAKTITEKFDGQFPSDYENILSLKGIGPYTASAIASIAFGIPKGVVDGNTLRIISRVCNRQDNIAAGKTKRAFQRIMDELIDPTRPSDFNQAMMDLGAMICTPKKPSCDRCPVASLCGAKAAGTVALLPVNIKPCAKNEIEYITAVLKYKNRYLLVKNQTGLLQNLYGLVQYEVESPAAFEDAFFEAYGVPVRLLEAGGSVKHVFTHRVWLMNGYRGEITGNPTEMLENFLQAGLYTRDEMDQIAISTAHRKVLRLFDI